MRAELVEGFVSPKAANGFWKLYKLSEPYTVLDWNNEPEATTEYLIVSAADVMFGGPETYIFPANADGEVTSWGELPGSYKGALDHDAAIAGFLREAAS